MSPGAVAGIAVSALAVQVVGLGVVGWSLANSVRYLAAVASLDVPNGRRVAARAILWRTSATAVALISTAVGAGLIVSSPRTLDLAADVWRSVSLLGASLSLTALAAADVYERVSLDRRREDTGRRSRDT